MAITFRTGLGRALTHAEMDENFSSVYFSSSLHTISATTKEVRLWFDNGAATPTQYHKISLSTAGGGAVSIDNDADNRIITANGDGTLTAEENFLFDGSKLTLTGRFEPTASVGIAIGTDAGRYASEGGNIAIGTSAGAYFSDTDNVAIGVNSLTNASSTGKSTAIGNYSLENISTGQTNTALGYKTAENVDLGTGNVYLGAYAGPATANVNQSNKLYINNAADDTPLIYGDFSTGHLTIASTVSASVFSGSFRGNGVGLTGITADWDGSRNGNAEITGSLIVSGGAGTKVDFTKAAAISGSIFSGSFVGDGSGLTGIISTAEWDGSRNGNAEITGSFIVSGSTPVISLKGVTTIDANIKIHNPIDTSIGIGTETLKLAPIRSIAIGTNAASSSAAGPVIAIGYDAGTRAGESTVYIGSSAGKLNIGANTVSVGSNSLLNASNVVDTVSIGTQALQGLLTGNTNTVIGNKAVWQSENGVGNTAIGDTVLQNLLEGDSNTAVGIGSGGTVLKKGTGNVYLGSYAGSPTATLENNQLYIDNSVRNDALIKGDFSARTLDLNALTIIIPTLPTDPAGLPTGALYRSFGVVCVVE